MILIYPSNNMEFTMNYASLAKKLESQELESPNGQASAQVYGQLLAIYLLFNDLTSAKFLWKRIPEEIKTSNQELSVIWSVGKLMWEKNYSDIYQAINSCPAWPNHLKNVMKLILESTRQRVTNLISKAYSSITLNDASKLLGLSQGETLELANSQCWNHDIETGYLIINHDRDASAYNEQANKSGQSVLGLENGTELLDKLTDYIMFLESTK